VLTSGSEVFIRVVADALSSLAIADAFTGAHEVNLGAGTGLVVAGGSRKLMQADALSLRANPAIRTTALLPVLTLFASLAIAQRPGPAGFARADL
jgi:hypothetical protein